MRWLLAVLLLAGCGGRPRFEAWRHDRRAECQRAGENGGQSQDGYGCRTGKGVLAGVTWAVR